MRLTWLLEKTKQSHKSPDTYEIITELIKAGGRIIRSETHKLINFIWNKEELPEQWKESIIVPIYMKGDKTYCSNIKTYNFFSHIHCSIRCPFVKFNPIRRGNYNYWRSSW